MNYMFHNSCNMPQKFLEKYRQFSYAQQSFVSVLQTRLTHICMRIHNAQKFLEKDGQFSYAQQVIRERAVNKLALLASKARREKLLTRGADLADHLKEFKTDFMLSNQAKEFEVLQVMCVCMYVYVRCLCVCVCVCVCAFISIRCANLLLGTPIWQTI
jgi:hypothetical protein